MKNFKITDSNMFKGAPKAIANTKNQVVSVPDSALTFSKGDPKKGQDKDKIHITIYSRVYINEAACIDTVGKDEELKTITAQVKVIAEDHNKLVEQYNKLKSEGKDSEAKAKESRAKHQEGLDLQPQITEIINSIDSTCYYQHTTEVVVDTIDELKAVAEDITLSVKESEDFKGLSTVDL